MSENKITALYERLSVGDEQRSGESVSIQNQKLLLEQYAKNHGFRNTIHYTDDDESGRFFDRPGYVQMMDDVESGKVGIILLKDSSRLGRDYIQVGLAMETMRLNNVRLIGVEDGLDTNVEDDFIPFCNVLHEFYAKDTSKKIKSTSKTKGMSGKHCTGTVHYGYLWDEKRENYLIDEEAAEVVRSIFRMTMEGFGPYQIANILKEKRIEIPSAHLARHDEGVNQSKTFKDIYGWGASTVVHILKKREYLGHTCNFKTRKHFKDKKSHYVDENEWTVFENTHAPIIDQDT
jgi:DNA invertase Pin-like site-specific DNA recombinase